MHKSVLRWRTLIATATLVSLAVAVMPDAAATRYKRETLADMVRQSAVVMIGTVVGIEYREDKETGEVFTDVKIRPVRAVVGGDQLAMEKQETMQLVFSGGLNAKGQMELVVGLPELTLGQTYLLFLRGGEWSLNPIAGWAQGALRLVAIEKGADHVMFNLDDQIVTGLKDGYLAYASLPQRARPGAAQGGCDDMPARVQLGTQTDLAEVQKRLSDSIYRENNVDELQKQDAERYKAASEDKPKRDRRARMRELLGEEPMTLSELVGRVKEIRSGMQDDIDAERRKYHPRPIQGMMRAAPATAPEGSLNNQEGRQ